MKEREEKKKELESLLIVVDMINGFIKEGKMADPYISHIIPGIKDLVERSLEEGSGVAFIKDAHNDNAEEFKKFPPHCIKGTSESQLVSELLPYEKSGFVYEKNSTSTLFAKGFMSDLEKMKKLREVIITGCCSDICILNAAIPLINYFDEHDRDVQVSVRKDLIETYDAPNHERSEYNEMALKLMKQAGIRII